MTSIKELREKHDALRKKYPPTETEYRNRMRPRNRRLGELLEIQEAQSDLIDALCEKVFK